MGTILRTRKLSNENYSTPKPKATPPKARPKPKWKPRLWLNKNLMNYPVARDPRTPTHWSKSNGRWVAKLPLEDRILLTLPADAPENVKRVTSGFDLGVLLQLIAEVQRSGLATVDLSNGELVRRMELEERSRYRQAVGASLQYLSWIGFEFDRWYIVGGKYERKVLPPPIAAMKGQSITLHPDWMRLVLPQSKRKRGYVERIWAALPLDAYEQNYHLMVLASAVKGQVEDIEFYYERGQSAFARKIGLSRKNRRPRLRAHSEKVEAWWSAHGGMLIALIGRDVHRDRKIPPGKIGFRGVKPPVKGGPSRSAGGRLVGRGGPSRRAACGGVRLRQDRRGKEMKQMREHLNPEGYV